MDPWHCTRDGFIKFIQLPLQNLFLLLSTPLQGGHSTGKTGQTGNLVLTFSRQGKHREFGSDKGKIC